MTHASMHGTVNGQVPELPALWQYRNKQKRKCSSLYALKEAIATGKGTVASVEKDYMQAELLGMSAAEHSMAKQ